MLDFWLVIFGDCLLVFLQFWMRVLDEAIDKVVRDPEFVQPITKVLLPLNIVRGAELKKIANYTWLSPLSE